MTSAGCARGITISGALGTVRAHGEYNYRSPIKFILSKTVRTAAASSSVESAIVTQQIRLLWTQLLPAVAQQCFAQCFATLCILRVLWFSFDTTTTQPTMLYTIRHNKPIPYSCRSPLFNINRHVT